MAAAVNDFDAIFFSLCDMHGVARGKVIFHPVIESVMRKGVGITQAVSVLGIMTDVPVGFTDYEEVGWRNGVMVPDASTLRPTPWITPHKLGHILCDLFDIEGLPDASSARSVLKQQVERLKDAGFRLDVVQQLEFNICTKGSKLPFKENEDIQPLLDKLKRFLPDSGIPVLGIKQGSKPWILQLSLSSQDALAAADTAHRLRYVIKSVCGHDGYTTTPMTCPFSRDSSTTHTLYYCLRNLDTDRDSFREDPSTGQHWLAGQLHHVPSTGALFRPTVNCYDYEGDGVSQKWSVFLETNAMEGLANPHIKDTRTSSACNPYIAIATVIASGLDGLQKQLPQNKQLPLDFPSSLKAGLENLDQSKEVKGLLGEKFISNFVKVKTDFEVLRFKDIDSKSDQEREEFSRYVYFQSL